MMKIIFAVFVLTALGWSSSSHKVNLFYQNKKISKKALKGRTILVAPLCEASTKISYTSKILRKKYKDLVISEKDLVQSFNEKYSLNMSRKFKKVKPVLLKEKSEHFVTQLTDEQVVKIDKPLGKYKVEYGFKYPSEDFVKSSGITPDLVIFLSNVDVYIKDLEKRNPMSGPAWNMTSTSNGPQMTRNPGAGPSKMATPVMRTLVKYIIWDYKNKDAVAYGQFQIDKRVNGKNIGSSWKYLASSILTKISSKVTRVK